MSSGAQRLPAPLFNAACCAALGIALADSAGSFAQLALALLPAALAYAWAAPGRLSWLALLLLCAGTAHHWQREHSPSRKLAHCLTSEEARTATVTGRLVENLKPAEEPVRAPRTQFLLRLEAADPEGLSFPGARILVHAKGEGARRGERLQLRVALRRVPPARNPGQADRAELWGRRGVWVEAFVQSPGDMARVSGPPTWEPLSWTTKWRAWISDSLSRGIEDKPLEHSLISSMVLGVRDAGLRDAEDWFRQTGTLHLFAVSGLNLTMLAWLLTVGLRMIGVEQRVTAILALPVLAIYGLVTGLGPSCLRALVGTVLFLCSAWLEGPSVALNSLGAAALVLLAADTDNLFHGGFQLSFCLVFALLWVATPLARRVAALFQPDPLLPRKMWSPLQRWRVGIGRGVASAVAATLVSFVGGLPWAVFVFHSVSPVGILVNLLVIPLAFGILSLGLCGVLCAPVVPWVAGINRLNALLAGVLLDVVRIGSQVPGGHWAAANPFLKKPDFVILDAGNGAALLLDLPGKPWLFDCGSDAQFDTLLLPALRNYGLDQLEGLALSHGDAAHIGAALKTQQLYRPRQFVASTAKDRSPTRKRLGTTALSGGGSLRAVSAGDHLQSGPLPCVEVLFPPRAHSASLADDKCLVVRFRSSGWSLLYTADSGYPTERWLLEHCREMLSADIWVRGSHIREATGTEAFVEAVNPKLIIVAGAPGGREARPIGRWADEWRARGREVWLQQETGAVEGWMGKSRKVRGYLNREKLSW